MMGVRWREGNRVVGGLPVRWGGGVVDSWEGSRWQRRQAVMLAGHKHPHRGQSQRRCVKQQLHGTRAPLSTAPIAQGQ